MLPRIKENPGFVAVTTETKILIAVEISHLDIDHEFKCNFMSLCVPQFVSLSCVVSLQSIVIVAHCRLFLTSSIRVVRNSGLENGNNKSRSNALGSKANQHFYENVQLFSKYFSLCCKQPRHPQFEVYSTVPNKRAGTAIYQKLILLAAQHY